jgi:hypothetical protein
MSISRFSSRSSRGTLAKKSQRMLCTSEPAVSPGRSRAGSFSTYW